MYFIFGLQHCCENPLLSENKKLKPNQEIWNSHNFENLNKRKDFQYK